MVAAERLSPSSFLPPLSSVLLNVDMVPPALRRLSSIYTPPVPGTRTKSENRNIWDDEYERSFAIRWLTALISRLTKDDNADHSDLIEQVASILATCSGVSATNTINRSLSFRYGQRLIAIDLVDGSINSHNHPGAVGMQTWGSASVLASELTENPHKFFASLRGPAHILELGAGTGLVSLVVSKLFEPQSVKILATDFDPLVLENLRSNVARNVCTSVRVQSLDWRSYMPSSPSTSLSLPDIPPSSFDYIFAADAVYEPEQAQWLKATVEHFLRPPSSADKVPLIPNQTPFPCFYLMVPLRHTHSLESKSILQTFPMRYPDTPTSYLLRTLSTETFELEDELGAPLIYILYRIGWDI